MEETVTTSISTHCTKEDGECWILIGMVGGRKELELVSGQYLVLEKKAYLFHVENSSFVNRRAR
jgi:hypothetical protein